MITKETVLDQISIDAVGHVQVRRKVRIMENGVELAHSYDRTSHTPDTPLADIPAGRLRDIASAVWTPQVKADYEAIKAAKPGPPAGPGNPNP